MYLLMVARQSGFEHTATLTHRAAKFPPTIKFPKPIFTLAEAAHRASMNSAVARIPHLLATCRSFACLRHRQKELIPLRLSERKSISPIPAKNRTSSPETT
jgi:hypothetical protein